MATSIKNYFNRWKLLIFNRKKLMKSIANRKGKCKKCGKCCFITLGPIEFFCPFLKLKDDGTKTCRIYPIRPYVTCQLPPTGLNKWENAEFKKKNCGYHW